MFLITADSLNDMRNNRSAIQTGGVHEINRARYRDIKRPHAFNFMAFHDFRTLGLCSISNIRTSDMVKASVMSNFDVAN